MLYQKILNGIQAFDLDKIDFEYQGNENRTIFNQCFQRYFYLVSEIGRQESDCVEVIKQIEDIFFYLLGEAESRNYDVKKILEIPTVTGQTCFSAASTLSEKISKSILLRNIKIHSIDTRMVTPQFTFTSLAISMMENKINPYVISYIGRSEIENYPPSFESEEAKLLLTSFSRSIHYSMADINCFESCLPDCDSNYEKFYMKEGLMVDMQNDKLIGEGGFGMVYEKMFHGKIMAMKCISVGDIEDQFYSDQAESEMKQDIHEYLAQLSSSGPGILIPTAVLRQQEQEQDDKGKWIAQNYNIFVYPKYDCNLYQLHKNHINDFTDHILKDILQQCLARKSS